MKQYDELRAFYEKNKNKKEIQLGGRLIEEAEKDRLSVFEQRFLKRTVFPFPFLYEAVGKSFCRICGEEFSKRQKACLSCGSPEVHTKEWISFLGADAFFCDEYVPPALKEYIPACQKMLKDIFADIPCTRFIRELIINSIWSFFVFKAAENNIPPEKWFFVK